MKKKLLATLLAGAMVISLAACGETTSTPAASTEAPAASTETPAASTEASTEAPAAETTEKVDLEMWCIATESDSNRHSYEAAIADITAAHPEINFTWEAIENQA